MPKFSVPNPDDDDVPVKAAPDEVRAVNNLPPTPVTIPNRLATNPTQSIGPSGMSGSSFGNQYNKTQMNPAVGLAQAEIDASIAKHQMEKQDEHWVKTYWRPAMGWLYMAMCAFDFIIFPIITIFLPIFQHSFGITMPYTEWKSLTLSNGGLIHIAFGAILGVAAYTRGQEKIAGKA